MALKGYMPKRRRSLWYRPMLNPFYHLFNPNEQKVLLFLLFFLVLGSILKLQGYNPKTGESAAAESLQVALKVDTPLKIDIRTANEKELQTLAGIGLKRAQSIIEYRNAKAFQNVNEIMQISGIGIKTYQKLLPNLVVFGDSSVAEKSKTAKSSTGTKSTAKVADESPVNINTGGIDELCKLNSIGKVKAQAIIDYRTQHGAFQSAEDICKVKGIGAATLHKNLHRIRL